MLADLKLHSTYDGLLYLSESNRNPVIIQSHHHIELELNLVVQGAVTYVVGGRRFTFLPRTLFWLFPHQEHQLVDRSKNLQLYVVVFKPSLIEKACHGAAYEGLKRQSNEEDKIEHVILKQESFNLVRETMNSIMENSLDSDLLNREAGYGAGSNFQFEHGDPDALNAGLHFLLVHCWRIQLTGNSAAHAIALHPAVRRALKVLSEADCDQSLSELAETCGTSSSYLSRMFCRQVGIPLNRYRNSLRLSKFFDEYRSSGGKTVTEAVFAAGFGSYAQFYKVFTQTYGISPRASLKLEN